MPDPFRGVAIVGAYNTKQAKRLEGISESELMLDAIRGTLAAAGVSLFAISTYDTDLILVRTVDRERAESALLTTRREGYK